MNGSQRKPHLIVVTGRPGAGKSTLAPRLAGAIRCPAVSRDELKEGLVNTTGEVGTHGDEITRQVYSLFFNVLRTLLSSRVTAVAEAAFQHPAWENGLESLRRLADIRVVVCDISGELARARRIERADADPQRERFHGDRDVRMVRQGLAATPGAYDPPRLGVPTLTVDTTDGYDPGFEAIRDFALSDNDSR